MQILMYNNGMKIMSHVSVQKKIIIYNKYILLYRSKYNINIMSIKKNDNNYYSK